MNNNFKYDEVHQENFEFFENKITKCEMNQNQL
jgi:hypothetical protein